jgi:hypothetical protein
MIWRKCHVKNAGFPPGFPTKFGRTWNQQPEMKITLSITAAVGLALSGASAADIDWSKLPPAATNSSVTFATDIQPLFKASCMPCHAAAKPRAGLNLESLDGVLKGTKKGPVLQAGDSADSLLVKAISRLDPESAMPPKPHRRGPRPGGAQGTNAPAMQPPPDGGPMPGGPGGPPPDMGGGNDHGPGGPPPMGGGDGQGGPPPGGPHGFGPPAKPLTADQVGLVRAWIDQGAK